MPGLFRLFSRRNKNNTDKVDGDLKRPLDSLKSNKRLLKKSLPCSVIFLDGSTSTFEILKKLNAQELYDRVYKHLDFVQEQDYFALQYTDTGNTSHWLDPTKSLKKQLSIGPPFTFHFRVKFYSADPDQVLRDELTRYLYVLQIKKDLLLGKLKCEPKRAAELAALVLQAELDDFDKEICTPAFISQYRFLPDLEQTEDWELMLLDEYEKLSGRHMNPALCEKAYLTKAKFIENYGVDMHQVLGKDNRPYRLGLTPTGILIYDGDEKIGLFFWPRIMKLEFTKARLKIVVTEDDTQGGQQDHSFVFSLQDARACKHLWRCAVEHHAFFRLVITNEPPSRAQKIFRMRSRFYYSFRTEANLAAPNPFGSKTGRQSSRFQRTPSQRFSQRPSFAKQELERKKARSEDRAAKRSETLDRLQMHSGDVVLDPKKESLSAPPIGQQNGGGGDSGPRSAPLTLSPTNTSHQIEVTAEVLRPPALTARKSSSSDTDQHPIVKPPIRSNVAATLSKRQSTSSSSASSSSSADDDAAQTPSRLKNDKKLVSSSSPLPPHLSNTNIPPNHQVKCTGGKATLLHLNERNDLSRSSDSTSAHQNISLIASATDGNEAALAVTTTQEGEHLSLVPPSPDVEEVFVDQDGANFCMSSNCTIHKPNNCDVAAHNQQQQQRKKQPSGIVPPTIIKSVSSTAAVVPLLRQNSGVLSACDDAVTPTATQPNGKSLPRPVPLNTDRGTSSTNPSRIPKAAHIPSSRSLSTSALPRGFESISSSGTGAEPPPLRIASMAPPSAIPPPRIATTKSSSQLCDSTSTAPVIPPRSNIPRNTRMTQPLRANSTNVSGSSQLSSHFSLETSFAQPQIVTRRTVTGLRPPTITASKSTSSLSSSNTSVSNGQALRAAAERYLSSDVVSRPINTAANGCISQPISITTTL